MIKHYTLQYNPTYKHIFDIHQKYNAVVYEDPFTLILNLKIIINQTKHKHEKTKKMNNFISFNISSTCISEKTEIYSV